MALCSTSAAFGQVERGEPASEGSTSALVPPRAILPLEVAYPESGQGQATVVLELVVAVDGTVSEARVVSGGEPFAGAALRAAPSFRFRSAERDGQKVAARIRLEVHFVPPQQPEPLEPAPGTEAATASATDTSTEAPLEVEVRGKRDQRARTLTRAEVRQLPGAFGDPFRAIEILPGITPMATGLPYFYVRGAPPGNVGYFLDGVRVPALYHVAVGPSVIHPAFIERVDLYPGPYPARYGHFAGGIVAAESAPPQSRFHGEASLRLVDAGAMLEAPVLGGRGSLMVAGRYSYTATVVSLLVPDLELAYWDYQARASARIDASQTVSLFGFGAHDYVAQRKGQSLRSIYDITFHRLELALARKRENGEKLRVSASTGVDQSASQEDGFKVRARNVGVRADWEKPVSGLILRLGSEARLDSYDGRSDARTFGNEFLMDFDTRFPDRDEIVLGSYGEAQLSPEPGIRITPGLRADFYGASEGNFGFSPRIMAEFDLGERLTLSHGLGVARQPPSFALPVPGLTPESGGGLQTSLQSSAGLSLELDSSTSTSITLFQSVFLDSSDTLGVSRLDNGDHTLDQSSRSLGGARGVELMLQRSLSERVGGFFSYTLSRSERSLGRAQGPSTFDRTHVLNLALAFDLGYGFRAGARGTFYSGIPGDVAYVEAAKHPPRTAPFYRFDWRVEKRWPLPRQGGFWALVLEVLNTTLHQEVLNVSCSAYVCREEVIGPITIPSLGLEAAF